MTRTRICDIHKGGTPGARYWTRGPKGAWPVPEARDLCGRCAGALMEQGQPLYLDEACKVLASTVGEARPSPPAPAPKVGGEPTRSRGTSAASHHEASPARPAAPVEQPPVPSVGSAAGGHPTSKEHSMKTCLVPRCKNSVKAKGRCSRHYELARDGGWRDEDPAGDLERIAEQRKTGQPRRAVRPGLLMDEQGVEQAAASVAAKSPCGVPGCTRSHPHETTWVDAAEEVSTVALGGDVAGAQALEEPGQAPAAQVEPQPSRVPWVVMEGTDALPWEDCEPLGVEWATSAEEACGRYPTPAQGYTRRAEPLNPVRLDWFVASQADKALDLERLAARSGRDAEVHRLRDQLAAVHALNALRAMPRPRGLPHGPLESLVEVLEEVAAGALPMPSIERAAAATWSPTSRTWAIGGNPR